MSMEFWMEFMIILTKKTTQDKFAKWLKTDSQNVLHIRVMTLQKMTPIIHTTLSNLIGKKARFHCFH